MSEIDEHEPEPKIPSAFKTTGSASKKVPSKAMAQRSRDTRLPTVRTGSVFDRLYKTQTAASKAWTPVRSEARKGKFATPSNRRKATRVTASVDDSLKVFQRLHITGTVSNTSKRIIPAKEAGAFSPQRKSLTPLKSMQPARTPARTPSRRSKDTYVYSPRMKPLTKLFFDSKYHPGIGKERVDPIKLGYSFFQVFCEYENEGITSEQIAREIIIAFFKKDFASGRYWEMHEPTVTQRNGEDHGFNVKMAATYDAEDARRVASAQGVVRCFPEKKEIHVLNYIYDVATDL